MGLKFGKLPQKSGELAALEIYGHDLYIWKNQGQRLLSSKVETDWHTDGRTALSPVLTLSVINLCMCTETLERKYITVGCIGSGNNNQAVINTDTYDKFWDVTDTEIRWEITVDTCRQRSWTNVRSLTRVNAPSKQHTVPNNTWYRIPSTHWIQSSLEQHTSTLYVCQRLRHNRGRQNRQMADVL